MKFGAPVWIVTAPQAGATAPAALAGTVVQVMAEAIASMLMVNLSLHPDIRSSSAPGRSYPICALAVLQVVAVKKQIVSAAAAQMTNFYGLVSSVGAGMSDAKVPDNQAGYEKALAVALAALAGCNNVSESAGMMGSLMGLSFESLVIDNDMLGAIMRTVQRH